MIAAVAGLALTVSVWPAAAHFMAHAPSSAWADEADVLGRGQGQGDLERARSGDDSSRRDEGRVDGQ